MIWNCTFLVLKMVLQNLGTFRLWYFATPSWATFSLLLLYEAIGGHSQGPQNPNSTGNGQESGTKVQNFADSFKRTKTIKTVHVSVRLTVFHRLVQSKCAIWVIGSGVPPNEQKAAAHQSLFPWATVVICGPTCLSISFYPDLWFRPSGSDKGN